MGNPPHILAIPYPAQGHVTPLMELSQCLLKYGFKVTFVSTDYNHKRVLNALGEKDFISDGISLTSIPDGMEPWEDRNELGNFSERIYRVMPGKLEELINRINSSEEEKINCVIADYSMGWAFEVAEKMKIRRVAFWPAAAALLSLSISIPKLIDQRIINSNGTPLKNQMVQLAPMMPSMDTAHFVWSCIGDSTTQKNIFDTMVRNNKAVKLADSIICNSASELEPGAFNFAPQFQSIGPLLASNRVAGNSIGNFWKEDSSCLKWLDQHPPNSTIYVAFGSFTIFDQTQFQELALGLEELSNRPFLWVVRADITNDREGSYPDGFHKRVGNRGLVVGWAPQQKVLSHKAIGVFVSHCGWNSAIEGVGNGVPFLCWPYFADQFLNESYICDVWKVGLRLEKNGSGIITREEIKSKVEQVFSDQNLKAKAVEMKEKALLSVAEGGKSNRNFKTLVEWLMK